MNSRKRLVQSLFASLLAAGGTAHVTRGRAWEMMPSNPF
jgi:hypothetical protein